MGDLNMLSIVRCSVNKLAFSLSQQFQTIARCAHNFVVPLQRARCLSQHRAGWSSASKIRDLLAVIKAMPL